MLFDLQGRGRRNTIKVIYVLLAVLIGGGLVLFGIGGGTAVQGGLVDAITGSNSGDTGIGRFEDRERRAAEATRRDPRDRRAWAELTRARNQIASLGDNYDAGRQAYTDAGRAKLEQAAQAWERYLALRPPAEEAARLAGIMVQAYSPAALNRPDEGVRAQELITEARPSSNTFAQLAVAAYSAGQSRKGDLAKAQAIERADPDSREALRGQLEAAEQSATSATGGASAPSP